MKLFFSQKQNFLLVLMGIVIVSGSFVYLLTTGNTFLHPPPTLRAASLPVSRPRKPATPLPTPVSHPLCKLNGRSLEMGVANPRWGNTGYGPGDAAWLSEIDPLRTQTAACWIEMPMLFYQSSSSSTTITRSTSAPDIDAFIYGVRYAHHLGLHVFAVPLLQTGGQQTWAGAIQFTTYADEQLWFTNYWLTLKPYLQAADQAGVEQFAIGTELEWLQENAPDELWNGLIANFASVYKGALTYDLNWDSLQAPVRTWMHNTQLKMIGVSAYIPLVSTPERVEPAQVKDLWAQTVKVQLDTFATQLGAPIFISEIGYRNSADDLYHTWESSSTAPADQEEQAAAYDAALANILADDQILGVFFWGWDNTGAFNLHGLRAVKVIRSYYSSLHS